MMINLADIHPHPDNPRRDAEAVDSLAESIKAQGILQALTVAPHPDTTEGWTAPQWIVIDGHRRYAAAQLLDLPDVPCIVRPDLTDRADQIAAMLATAREREDLSAAEEATGVQAMLDLGENVSTIAARTGMSKTKVRQRAKVAGLPPEILEKVHKHHVTLADAQFVADHPDHRDELEPKLGTNDWPATRQRIATKVERNARVEKQFREAEKLGVLRLTSHNAWIGIHELTGLNSNDLEHVCTRTWSIAAWEGLPEEQREFAYVRAFDYDNVVSLLIYKRIANPAAPAAEEDTDEPESASASAADGPDPDPAADAAARKAAYAAAEDAERKRREERDKIVAATEVRVRFLTDLPATERERWVPRLLCLGDPAEGWWIDFDMAGAINADTDYDDANDDIRAWLQTIKPLDFAWHCAVHKLFGDKDTALRRLPHAGVSPAFAEDAIAYAVLLREMGHVLSDIEIEIVAAYQEIVDKFEARLDADPGLRAAADQRKARR